MKVTFGLGEQAQPPAVGVGSPLLAAAATPWGSAILAGVAGSVTGWVLEEYVTRRKKKR